MEDIRKYNYISFKSRNKSRQLDIPKFREKYENFRSFSQWEVAGEAWNEVPIAKFAEGASCWQPD